MLVACTRRSLKLYYNHTKQEVHHHETNVQKIIIALTMASLFLSFRIPVLAAENEPTATYDLTRGGIQTFNCKDFDGNDVIITITELPSLTRNLENRTYAVSCHSLLSWKAGYNVVIYNNSISSVNSPYYTCLIGSINSASLRKDSSKQATLRFIYKAGGLNITTGVRTNIIDKQLKVTVL